MLGFQTDRDFEFLVFDWTQIGVVLGLGFIAKQRSDFGFDPSLQGYHFTLSFKLFQLFSEQPTPLFLTKSKSPNKSLTICKHNANHSWDEIPSPCSTLDRYTAVA